MEGDWNLLDLETSKLILFFETDFEISFYTIPIKGNTFSPD